MKKLLAIMLCVAMLFSVLVLSSVSASTTEPSVRIITNEGSPVKGELTTFFCIRFDNFTSIKGVDVTVTAEGAEIQDIRTTGNLPEAEGDNEAYTENFDINNDATELHFVDFNDGPTSRIIFKVTSPTETSTVKIVGKYAATGADLFDVEVPAIGSFEIKQNVETKNVTSTTLEQPDVSTNTFIPYGSVYKGDANAPEFAEKNAEGVFEEVDSTYKYSTFNLPQKDSKLAAFGASKQIKADDTLLFGIYSKLDKPASEHGVMIVEGDWRSLKEYYIKNGYTVQECLELLSNDFDKKTAGTDKYYVSYGVPDKDFLKDTEDDNLIDSTKNTKVTVYKFKRTNEYIWRGEGEKLEYALRLHGIKKDTDYTSVGYCVVDGKTELSFNVKHVEAGDIDWSAAQ